ncbi:hypothetical protein [Sorangium sp. So ce854]|uniref:hypothetical protein n=1 Tax=Sorangium sp. So ce854 TaxID=3133322 RepID=UPI003F638772
MGKPRNCRPTPSTILNDLRTYPCLIKGCHCNRRVRIKTAPDGRIVAYHVRD